MSYHLQGKDPHERALKKYFSRFKYDERTYTDMIKQFGDNIEHLEVIHAIKMKTVTHVYSDHEKKYLNENLLWGCTKFIGSKEFRSEMRGLSPPVTDSGMAPSSG